MSLVPAPVRTKGSSMGVEQDRLNALPHPKFCCSGIEWEYREKLPWDGMYVPTRSVIREKLCNGCNSIHRTWYSKFYKEMNSSVPNL